MIRLTARGWSVSALAAVTLGAGWWWRYAGLLALGAAFAVLVLAALASVTSPIRVRATRSVQPLIVERSQPCTAIVELVHSGRGSAQPLTVADPDRVAELTVRRGATREVGYAVPTGRRGLVTVGPLRLSRPGVGGLAERAVTAAASVTVRVLPRVLPLRVLPAGAGHAGAGAEERIEHLGTDLVGMREYLPGDDVRRLHWGTSARTGTLMVREDADPSLGHITVLLDDRAGSYPAADGFEEAVDVAASIAAAAVTEGHPVRICSVSGAITTPDTAPDAVATLADAGLVASPAVAPLTGSVDVLAVVGGAGTDAAALAGQVDRAGLAVALLVAGDGDGDGPAGRSVPVLRAAEARELLRRWDDTLWR